MQATLLVMAGGAAGSALRYNIAQFWPMAGPEQTGAVSLPWPTLTVNVVGGFAMGLLFSWLVRFEPVSADSWRLLLGVGFLGGFTTFSAFSLELFQMLGRGAWLVATGYALLSVLAALLALIAGHFVVRSLL